MLRGEINRMDKTSKNDHSSDQVDSKLVRVGIEEHRYLKFEALKKDMSMKDFLDELINEHRKQNNS